MFDWLFEGRVSVIVVLAAALVVLLLVWYQTRKRHWLTAAGVTAGLLGLYLLLDWVVVTDREADRQQIRARTEDMVAAARRHDADGLMRYVSDRFRSPQGLDRAGLHGRVQASLAQVPEVELSRLEFVEEPSRSAGKAVVVFVVAARDGGKARCETVWDYDPQAGWRVQSAKVFYPDPTNNEYPY